MKYRMILTVTLTALLTLLTSAAMAEPLKVYILSGQSNMVGMASANTLEHIKMTEGSALAYADVFDAEGKPVVLDDVRISYNTVDDSGKLGPEWGARGKGPRIGPEYGFGIYMHKALGEPILLIKTAWGGKSLCFDFRPPSAGQWTPPPGHPDLTKIVYKPIPLPKQIDLPSDYVPSEDILPPYPTGRVGKFMGLRPMRGVEIGKVNGVYPIYLTSGPEQQFPGDPFMEGDLIIGVDGQGLRKDAIGHWREVFHGSKQSDDWVINVTRWRNGKIESFDFDISQTLPGGRADIPKVLAEARQRKIDNEKNKGHYYRAMMAHIKNVLGDIKAVHPEYDPAQGYEIAGFVWFQGWNDMVNGGTYPNRDKLRGYEQYTWLLEHFIHDVRKELDAPGMPFVIGVMGVGGVEAEPISVQSNFRRAMAAPAYKPEFQRSVAAVYTENYWDTKLDMLDQRSHKVNQYRGVLQHRDGLKGAALNEAYAKYRAQFFTPEEELYLKVGKSNQGFHYLGSGKFMVGAGKGFAQAMLKLHAMAKLPAH